MNLRLLGPKLSDSVFEFLGQVSEIHLEGERHESGVSLEDINLIGGGRLILIQVKTKQAAHEQWKPGDQELLKALQRFYECGSPSPSPEHVRFVFLTNRSFNKDLERIKSAIQYGTLDGCEEASKLRKSLAEFRDNHGGSALDDSRFRTMLAHTAFVQFPDLDSVETSIQVRLQAYGQTRLAEVHSKLFKHMVKLSTQRGGGKVTCASIVDLLGSPTDISQAPVPRGPKPPCPYPGMRPLGEDDRACLFGRDVVIQELVRRLSKTRFLAIIGDSGAGKSSLVAAGLVPELSTPEWHVESLRPLKTPLANLAGALGGDPKDPDWTVSKVLANQPNAHRLLLVVDQFEEVFDQEDKKEALSFQQSLLHLAEKENCYVVLAIRSDFYPQVMKSPLGERVDAHHYWLRQLGPEGLKQAIVRPGQRVGVFVDPGLAERIVGQARYDATILPFVQETLVLLWDRMEKSPLTLRHYDALVRSAAEDHKLGGEPLVGLYVAIAEHCNDAYGELMPEGKAIAQRILLSLVKFGRGAPDTRQQQSVANLRASGDDPELFDHTLNRLADKRLVTLSGEEGHEAAKADLTHDALISGWPALQGWILQRHALGLRRDEVASALQRWKEAREEPEQLLKGVFLTEAEGLLVDPGVHLTEAEGLLVEPGVHLSPEERTFIQCSVAQRELERAKTDEQLRIDAKLQAEQRTSGELRRLATRLHQRNTALVVLAIALSVAVAIALRYYGIAQANYGIAAGERDARATEVVVRTTAEAEAVLQRDAADRARSTAQADVFARATAQVDAEKHRDQAEAARSEADRLKLAFASQSQLEKNHELALLLALQAERINQSPEAEGALRAWFLHRGRTVALLVGHTGPVTYVAWSSDGGRIVTASRDGTARVWDADSGAELLPSIDTGKALVEALWSPVDRRLVTVSRDGMTRVWDGETGKELPILSGDTAPVNCAAWSPEGSRLAMGSVDGTARVWDAETGRQLVVFKVHSDPVNDISWSPDGEWIATASDDHTVRIRNPVTGVEKPALIGHTQAVLEAVWSPDGNYIATASSDSTARLWDVKTGAELCPLIGHTGSVWHVAWSPDSQRVVTAGFDSAARVWDAETGAQQAILSGHTTSINHLAWSPDGRFIVTASKDGTARVWDAEAGAEVALLSGHADWVSHVAWSPDGERVASVSRDGTARVWDFTSGGESAVFNAHKAPVKYAAWSQDGTRIVTTGKDETARVWDAATGAELAVLSHGAEKAWHAAWSPDGSQIAVTTEEGTVRVWNMETGTEMAVLSGYTGPVWYVAWSPDSERVATAGGDGTARVWDAKTGQELTALTGHTLAVLWVAWSPNGELLVTTSMDRTARIWDLVSGAEIAPPLQHAGPVWNAEWSPDGQHIITASDKSTARVWSAKSGTEDPVLSGHTGPVTYATWSPDGRYVAAASKDSTARVWDAISGASLAILSGHKASVSYVAWSQDGERIATASEDGTARLWDPKTGAELAVLGGHTAWINCAIWSPNGDRIVTASGDRTARIYYTRTEVLEAAACQRAVRNMSVEEWYRYMGDQPYRETCPGKPVPGQDYWMP